MISVLFNKYKRVLYILLLPYLFLIFIFTFPIKSYDVTLPGNMKRVERDIVIEGDLSMNNFYTVYVMSPKIITPFQVFLSSIDNRISIDKKVKPLVKYTFEMGQIHEELSYQYAIINAYTLANQVNENISIDYEKQGYQILYSISRNGKSGDVITKLDGKLISLMDQSEVNLYFDSHERITVTYMRNGSIHESTYIKENGKFGISIYPYYRINKAFPAYKSYYHQDLIGGPSGGLIQTLKIYTSLLNLDFDNLKIGGTGTIDIDGNIGGIGGIRQKIYTAQGRIDLFFVPEKNYEEALIAYQTIDKPTFLLVKVSTIHEAITRLSEYIKA